MKQFLFFLLGAFCISQAHTQNSYEVLIAQKIAQKMRDSLNLSSTQQEGVYAVNLQLHTRKMQLREQSLPLDSLSKKIQRVENSRDSLYRPILTQQQFDLYRQKKRNLVSAN